MTTLATLNDLRVAAGKSPLKVWKASKAALVDAIAKLEGTPSKSMAASVVDAIVDVVHAVSPKPAKPVDIVQSVASNLKPQPSLKKTATKKPAPVKGGTSITTIAEELGIDPKVARAKLRRHDAKRKGSTWSFTNAADVAAIKKILGADKRKKS